MIVVDDRLLFEVLSGTESAEVRGARIGWDCDDVLVVLPAVASNFDRTRRRVADREFASLSDARRTYVHGLLEDLPDTIEILHPRDLVPPPMSATAALTSVNFLTAEAIAASIIPGSHDRRLDTVGVDGSGSSGNGRGRVPRPAQPMTRPLGQ